MRLDDIPEIFELGKKFGVVGVLGAPMRSDDGFEIGAPEAAGGSDLYVSGREHDYIEGCSMGARYVLANDCLLMGWVDDVVHVQPRKGR